MSDIYEPEAIYHSDSDCLEYIRQDGGIYYHRIDDILTLIKTIDGKETVGFKLKGFKYFLQNHEVIKLDDEAFDLIISVFRLIFTILGRELFGDSDVFQAYNEAAYIAQNDNVKFDKSLREALIAA